MTMTTFGYLISIGHFRVPLCPCFSESKCKNHSNENKFDLHENELVGGTHCHLIVLHLDSF